MPVILLNVSSEVREDPSKTSLYLINFGSALVEAFPAATIDSSPTLEEAIEWARQGSGTYLLVLGTRAEMLERAPAPGKAGEDALKALGIDTIDLAPPDDITDLQGMVMKLRENKDLTAFMGGEISDEQQPPKSEDEDEGGARNGGNDGGERRSRRSRVKADESGPLTPAEIRARLAAQTRGTSKQGPKDKPEDDGGADDDDDATGGV